MAAPSREKRCGAYGVRAGFLAPGSLPASLPSPVTRVAAHAAPVGGGLAGYSGGTAQAFDLLPFSPSM